MLLKNRIIYIVLLLKNLKQKNVKIKILLDE